MGYGITEVARRTGFPPPTLRYYEQRGVLPPADRTAAGYRVYDDRTIERLGFVARAKQLGCTLEEITALLAAFDADCAGVQARLRLLIDDKIAAAGRQMGELAAFTDQLRQAAAALGSGAPAGHGPCAEACGCGVTVAAGVTVEAETAAEAAETAEAAEIVCTLGSAGEVRDRVEEWQAVLGFVTARTPVEGGLRLDLAADAPLEHVVRLAQAEQGCCSFFSFALTVDGRGAALEVRAPEAGRDVLASLFGAGGPGAAST